MGPHVTRTRALYRTKVETMKQLIMAIDVAYRNTKKLLLFK